VTDPRRLRPDEAWDAVLAMVRSDEAQRVEALTAEELDREVAATGRDPAAERARGAALAASLLEARAAKASPRRSNRLLWLVAAALAVGLVLLANRREVMAWIHGGDRTIVPLPPTPDERPSPVEQAERLRDEAEKACHGGLWGRCASKLDDAAKLDPAGDARGRAQALHAAIQAHTTRPDGGPDPKGPP
jgi:hypothetical protein